MALKRIFSALVTITLFTALLIVGSGSPASAANAALVVNSTGDQPDANVGDGKCLTSTGVCTLRAAIAQANANRGPDRIEFNIDAGGGVAVISPATQLPELWGGDVTIDGYTQPGSSPNTLREGTNAKIKVQINGGGLDHLLVITSAANTIRGLSVFNAETMIYLVGEGADGNVIIGNLIGTDVAASFQSSVRQVGVEMDLGPDRNMVGRPTVEDRNVFAGYGGHGVLINHGDTAENRVQNNMIGLSPDQSRAMAGHVGIDVQWWTWDNLVGGYGDLEGNVVSGNTTSGIDLSHSATHNSVIGNRVGTLANGNQVTSYSGNKYGIAVKDKPVDNYIGSNVTGGNEYGIFFTARYNGAQIVEGNKVGVGLGGASIGNGTGIFQRGHDQLFIDNVIAHSKTYQMVLSDTVTGDSYFNDGTHTERVVIRENQFYDTKSFPEVDIRGATGYDANDAGDGDSGPNQGLNTPEITGIGPNKVLGTTCAFCEVDVYVTAVADAGGYLQFDNSRQGYGRLWAGAAKANRYGKWNLVSDRLPAGKQVTLQAVDGDGNTSELSRSTKVPTTHTGTGANLTSAPSLPPYPRPERPTPPPAYGGTNYTIVRGTVATSSGVPVSDVAVEWFTANPDGSRGQWVTSTSTTSNGTYTLYPKTGGCGVITFIAPRGEVFASNQSRWLEKSVCVETGGVAEGANATIFDRTSQATLSGTLTGDSGGVAGAYVDLFSSADGTSRDQWKNYAVTDSNGGFSFDVEPGCWAITYIAPDGQQFPNGTRFKTVYKCVASGESASVGTASLQSSISSGTITGQITRSGAPVGEVGTNLYSANADGSRGAYLGWDLTDANGTYSYAREAGCYVTVLIAPAGHVWEANGGAYFEKNFCLSAGQTLNRPTATLRIG